MISLACARLLPQQQQRQTVNRYPLRTAACSHMLPTPHIPNTMHLRIHATTHLLPKELCGSRRQPRSQVSRIIATVVVICSENCRGFLCIARGDEGFVPLRIAAAA